MVLLEGCWHSAAVALVRIANVNAAVEDIDRRNLQECPFLQARSDQTLLISKLTRKARMVLTTKEAK
jgi:hypothetical protein